MNIKIDGRTDGQREEKEAEHPMKGTYKQNQQKTRLSSQFVAVSDDKESSACLAFNPL